MSLTLWILKSEVAGVPLRKGPAWRSTISERGFVYLGCLWIGSFCGFALFCFFLEVGGFLSSFPTFPFVQELQTSVISKKFSVSRDALAPHMKNA